MPSASSSPKEDDFCLFAGLGEDFKGCISSGPGTQPMYTGESVYLNNNSVKWVSQCIRVFDRNRTHRVCVHVCVCVCVCVCRYIYRDKG